MDFIDLSNKQCPEGHTTLKVTSQKNDCYIVTCTTCGNSYYEHDLHIRTQGAEHEHE